MRRQFFSTLLWLGAAASLGAGEFSQDIEAGYNASGGARTNLGKARNGDISEQNTHFQYVLSYAIPNKPVTRAGVGFDRFDFGLPGRAPVPNSLQSLNVVAGVDLQISDVIIRLEARPGFYGDLRNIRSRDFNVPVVIGLSLLVNKDLQWIAGISIDANRNYPVLGAIGVRWKFSDRWVLNAVPPDPRIEFLATDALTFFAGGHIVGSTFRVNDGFGSAQGNPKFNNAVVDLTEIRTGIGLTWKISPLASLDLELGYMAYRDFDFARTGDNFETKSGSLYGQFGLGLRF
jgi:hypothetical protein